MQYFTPLKILLAVIFWVYSAADFLATMYTLPGDLDEIRKKIAMLPDLVGWITLVLAVLVTAFIFWSVRRISLVETASKATPPPAERNVRSVTIGGDANNAFIHAGDVLAAPPARTLNDNLREGLQKLVSDGKPIEVLYLNGDSEAKNFAEAIHNYLRDQDANLKSASPGWHMFGNPPVRDVDFSTFNSQGRELWHIIVGPAA